MKTKSILFSALVLSAFLARGQAPSGQGVQPSGQGGSQTGQTAGQRQVGQGSQRFGVQGQTQTGQTSASGAVTNTRPNGIGANQPIDPERQRILLPQDRPVFGGTNQIVFGTTNRPFGSTNQLRFGGTNRVAPFATNAGPSAIVGNTNGTIINDASGAAANQNGIFLPPVNANGAAVATNGVTGQVNAGATNQSLNNTEDVFNQRLRAALLQTGATRIYFPQTRSTVTVANQNGTVMLTGMVTSEAEKQEIEKRIRKTQGVTIVDNQLKVLAGSPPGVDQRSTPTGDQRLRTP